MLPAGIGTHSTLYKLFYVTNLAETKSRVKKGGLFSLMLMTSWSDPAITDDGARQEIGLGGQQQVIGLQSRTEEDQGNGGRSLLLVEALSERQNFL